MSPVKVVETSRLSAHRSVPLVSAGPSGARRAAPVVDAPAGTSAAAPLADVD